MATNPTPRSIAELLDLGKLNVVGMNNVGAAIGLVQYTAANYQPLIDALQGGQNAFNAARAVTAAAAAVVHTDLVAMRKLCLTGRKLLSISWGDPWSPQWAAAGWNNNTTEVPRDAADLTALCTALSSFLSQNPDYVVDTPKITFTAAVFDALIAQLNQDTAALAGRKAEQKTAMDARAVDAEALRGAMRGLVHLLGKLLDPNDPNWDQFGLNRPGATVTPDQAQNLALAQAGTGTVNATCDATPTATYYRWFAQLVAVDGEFRFLGRTNDPNITIDSQPAAGTLKVKVEAANEAGHGVASDVAGIALS